MTAPSLLDELEGVVRRITDDAAEVRRTGGDPERERHTQRIAVNFIRTHHAEIADMAKRMEAAERDAAELRMCKGEYAMPDGTIAKCHVNVGVNVWHGERWLAFHECSPDQLRLIIDAATQEGEG